ncbi:transposase [Arthrobacter mobilis]|uniref:transposase n=1 Tax=Arthrobacter mobilis TaxID=2724944 RepID=UPI0028AC2310|nr:transposase [Arthrobacter mobilis]
MSVPDTAQEAARDLVRAREDCRGDLMRARHRLSKLLLRHGIVYAGGAAWTGAHDAWLRREAAGQLTLKATRMAFDSEYEAVLAVKARRDRLDAAIAELAAESEAAPLVRRLGCLRGVSTLTGFALAAGIGDWHRFTGATIASFVGLTPAEHSSGASRTQGPDIQDRQLPRPPAPGPGPHGTTGPAIPSAKPCATGGTSLRPRRAFAATRATGASTTAG